jgi:hypothetical protein
MQTSYRQRRRVAQSDGEARSTSSKLTFVYFIVIVFKSLVILKFSDYRLLF